MMGAASRYPGYCKSPQLKIARSAGTRLMLSQCGHTTSLALDMSWPFVQEHRRSETTVNRRAEFMGRIRSLFKQATVVAGVGPGARRASWGWIDASDSGGGGARTQEADHENGGVRAQTGELARGANLVRRQ